MRRDPDLPLRAFELSALARVRDGIQYDHLTQPFSEERTGAGEYVPMSQRRPSCKSNLCAVVVSNSASLLFSEHHFPKFFAADDTTLDMLEALVKYTRLPEVMIEAAIRGSIGSVAIHLRVLRNRPYFQVLETIYLTPTFDPEAPDTLLKVTERYKVDAAELIERGYDIDPKAGQHWFQRVWDANTETWYVPKPVGEPGPMRIDQGRSTVHNLGFCPILWVKNLPNGPSEFDGQATFLSGIDTVIELDYLMSQNGRGLKYSSDPTLVITGADVGGKREGGSATALILPEVGDAKLLEISGQAAGAVLEQCKYLREQALEAMGGVRTAPERIVGAQSGKALEMLCTPAIWLADRLRVAYGEGALVSLAHLVCRASKQVAGGIVINDKPYVDLNPDGIGLRWAEWFEPTPNDELQSAQALQFLIASGVLSAETGTKIVAPRYDIEDADAERATIDQEAQQNDARQVSLQTKLAPLGKPPGGTNRPTSA